MRPLRMLLPAEAVLTVLNVERGTRRLSWKRRRRRLHFTKGRSCKRSGGWSRKHSRLMITLRIFAPNVTTFGETGDTETAWIRTATTRRKHWRRVSWPKVQSESCTPAFVGAEGTAWPVSDRPLF